MSKYQPCRCEAYSFPHRPRGGNCQSYPSELCAHGIPWHGVKAYNDGMGYWCDECASNETQSERREELSAAQRNPSLPGRIQ